MASASGRLPSGIEAIRRSHRKQPGSGDVLRDLHKRLLHLRGNRASVHQCEFRTRFWFLEPVTPGDDRLPLFLRKGALRLGDGPGGEPEVDRPAAGVPQPPRRVSLAAVALNVVERPAEDDREFVHKGWFKRRQSVLCHADQGGANGLMRPAFRRERDSGGRGHEDEAGVLVTGVVERVQPPVDERIVERGNRQQPCAEEVVRQPKHRQHQEEVVFRDAQLDVLSGRRQFPLLHRGDLLLPEGIGSGLAVEDSASVDPAAEVGGNRDVRREGDDVIREWFLAAGKVGEHAAKALLRGSRFAESDGQGLRNRKLPGLETPTALLVEGHLRKKLLKLWFRKVQSRKPLPLLAGVNVVLLAELLHLLRIHQARVVVLVSGKRQVAALDGVGDDARWHLAFQAVEGFVEYFEVVSGEVRHQLVQRLVRILLQQRLHPWLVAEVGKNPLAPHRTAFENKRGVEAVRTLVNPLPQGRASRFPERLLQPPTVLQRHHPPAHHAEEVVNLPEKPVRDHGIEALPVVVNDPPGVAQPVFPALVERLENVALVEFRITHQRDHPPRWVVFGTTQFFELHIILHEAGEGRDRRAQPHRTGREIHIVCVLGARGVRLRPAIAAELLQILLCLVAKQVLNRVEHRTRMRLDGNPVLWTQHIEIQHRHDRCQRCGRGLVPADLEAVRFFPEVVRVVDHPRRQPEHLALQFRQCPECDLGIFHRLRGTSVAHGESGLWREGVAVWKRHESLCAHRWRLSNFAPGA